MGKKAGLLTAEHILENDGDVEKALLKRRQEGAKILRETGSMPAWWDCGVSMGKQFYKDGRGAPPKFPGGPDEYYSLGYEYFEECAENGDVPVLHGLILKLGFASSTYFYNHVRRNPEFREVNAALLSLLKIPLERGIYEPGGQSGKMFLLKNIPDGFEPTDPANKRLEYSYKDRQHTEHTGADGGPILISRDEDVTEAYRKMMEGGLLLEEEDASVAE